MPFADRPDCRLFYSEIDATPPWADDCETVLFHHGVSATGALWSDWIPELCDRYRIVRFDTRGFGRSVPLPPGAGWTTERMVADIMAVADAAGAHRFHLVGESAGGTMALAATLAHPGRVISLTISNGAHKGTAVQNVGGRWRDQIASEGQEAWADQMMEWRFYPGGLPEAKRRWFRDVHATCSTDAALGLADLLLRTDLSADVERIACPTLILSPDSSPFIPVAVAADLHARIAGSELQVFPHARHGLPMSHGRACAQAMRAFLERRCR